MQINRWYHIAVVFDGSRERWLYINGEEKGHELKQSYCTPRSQSSPLSIGYASVWPGANFNGLIQHVQISSVMRNDFAAGKIDIPSSLAAGAQMAKPNGLAADLAIKDVQVFPDSNRSVMVEVTVQNVGSGPTQNNFFTDIFLNQLPVGIGGSLHFWVNGSIEPGATVKLSTIIESLPTSSPASSEPGSETIGTLYARVDSSNVVYETNKTNNDWPTGTTVCTAAADAYETIDNVPVVVSLGQQVQGNFDQAGDVDWFKFDATMGQTYQILTTNLGVSADTVLSLYDQDTTTLLSENDDSGRTLASSIYWQAPANGVYYVRVKSWNATVHGCGTGYTLNVILPGSERNVYLPFVNSHP